MTKEEITKKHESLLKEKGSLLATEDGQVFYNNQDGKNFASGHAAAIGSEIFELKYKAPTAKKKTTKKEDK